MPSFDIVSKPDLPSVNNAIDGVQREISTRYDFKGSLSKVEISENVITITADDELKRKQVGSHYLKTGLSHKILMHLSLIRVYQEKLLPVDWVESKEYSSLISQL